LLLLLILHSLRDHDHEGPPPAASSTSTSTKRQGSYGRRVGVSMKQKVHINLYDKNAYVVSRRRNRRSERRREGKEQPHVKSRKQQRNSYSNLHPFLSPERSVHTKCGTTRKSIVRTFFFDSFCVHSSVCVAVSASNNQTNQ